MPMKKVIMAPNLANMGYLGAVKVNLSEIDVNVGLYLMLQDFHKIHNIILD